MPLIDKIREMKLIELAQKRYDPDLSDAEKKVLHDSASSENLPEPGEKAPRPEVRADFLRWLATDPKAAPHINPKGLRVSGATILGPLDLRGSRVMVIINCWRCTFSGMIDLRSAETRGILLTECTAAQTGIRGDRLVIHGPFLFRRCQFGEEIRMLGVRIEGNLDGSGANLTSRGISLALDRAEITGNVVLSQQETGASGDYDEKFRFTSSGTIRLHNARVSGQLKCSGAKLATEGNAFVLDGAEIQGTVYFDKGLDAGGAISMAGSKIAGDLAFSCARIATVYCANMQLLGDLIWLRIQESGQTRLFLGGARVRTLRDDRLSWPNQGEIDVVGLTYEELSLHEPPTSEDIRNNSYASELPLIAGERIEWLMLQPPERRMEPQPWMQLRDLLERKGERKQAKYVLFRFRCLQAQKSWILWRWMKILFALLEENPFRIGYLIALTLLIGTSIFAWGGSKQAMIETVRYQPNAITDNGQVKLVSPLYPKYQPFVYTLENAVPLIKLGMDEKWAPNPSPEFCRPWFPNHSWLYFVSTYGWLNFWRWALIVGGWVQATIFAAAVADRFRK
ncbi:MAG: hypothetical protein ABSC77_13190 [Terracidiphilus sp.]|jgi:hypothetical protein